MEEIIQKLIQQESQLNEIASTVKKIKLYFVVMLSLSVATFIIPLVGLIFVVPWFLKTVGSTYQGLL